MTIDNGSPSAERTPLHPLLHLSVLVSSQAHAVAEANGLTPMQARVLGQLDRGPQRMADLAKGLGIEKPALTGLVDRAEAKGLMTRAAVPGDRRSTNVIATEEGAAAARGFYEQLDAVLDGLIVELPSVQREAFRRGLETMISGVSAEEADIC